MYGENVKRDYAKAFGWCTVAANRGNAHAQTLLTELYLNGKGTKIDYSQALRLAKTAGSNGHPVAQYYVGLIYYKGLGVTQDHAEAEKWLAQSARANIDSAKELLGKLGDEKKP